jgi:hypothetical protein
LLERRLRRLPILKKDHREVNVYLDDRELRAVSNIKRQFRGDDPGAYMFRARKRMESVADLALAISRTAGCAKQQEISSTMGV